MAGNKYQRYLNDDRASSRSSRSEDNTGSVILGAAAIVGGVIGARYLYREGVFDGALNVVGKAINGGLERGKTATAEFGALVKAVKQTSSEEGVWRTFSGLVDDTVDEHLAENLSKVHAKLKAPLSGENIDLDLLLQKAGKAKGKVMDSFIDMRRHESIKSELGAVMGKDSELFKDVSAILDNTTNNKGFLDHANNGHLFQDFKRYGLHEKYSEDELLEGAQQLEAILSRYRGDPTEWAKPISKVELRNKAKEFGNIIDKDVMEMSQPKDTRISRLMGHMGYRYATVEDAMKNPDWFKGIKQYTAKRGKRGSFEAEYIDRDVYKHLQTLVKNNPEASKLTLGKAIMIDIKTGKLADMRYASRGLWKGLESASENVQVPFVNINPFRLLHMITIEGVRKAESFAILGRGTKQPFLTGNAADLAEDLLYSNGKVFNINTGKLMKKDVYLASNRYGLFKRIAENMAELGEQKTGSAFKELFDIGLQERDSDLKRGASTFTKFGDQTWEPNLIHGIRKQYEDYGEVSEKVADVAYRKIYDTLNRKVRPLDDGVMKKFTPLLKEMFPNLDESDILMESNEQVMMTLGKLLKMETTSKPGTYSVRTGIMSQLKSSASTYSNNKDIFEMIEQAVSDPELALPGFMDSLQPSKTRMVTKYEDTKRIIQQEMISQLDAHRVDYGDVVSSLTNSQSRSVSELGALSRMRRAWAAVHGFEGDTMEEAAANKTAALNDFVGILTNPSSADKATADSIEKAVNRYSPAWGFGPGDRPTSAFGKTSYIVMNKMNRHPIESANEVFRQGGNIDDWFKTLAEGTVGQLGFGPKSIRAGRDNLDKVTTLTAGAYYYFDRLNEGIARAGLGLSQKSLGSAQDVFSGLLFKRFGLAVGAITAARALDYQTEDITGVSPSKTLGKAYVNMTLDAAFIKDVTGITDLNKMLGRMMPGSEKLFKNPVGGALKYGSFGIIGDDRSEDELREYWTRGNDELRRGRWWGIGSNTPWYGGKIDHFRPNWYRRQQSDYLYTNVLYGSKDEYWKYSWMPTLSHPLAPLNRLLDPNHWANKHRDDRPYPVVGGYSELENLPLVGPAVNAVVGGIFNPQRKRGDLAKAHRQYIQDINESIKQGSVSSTGYLYITPSGGTQTVAVSGGNDWGSEADSGIGYATVAPLENGQIAPVDATAGFAPMQSGKMISGMQLTGINRGVVSRANIGPIRGTNLEDLRNKDYIESLDEVVDPTSLGYRLGETFYSATEIGGIYGFAITAFTGQGESRKPVLARSMDMDSSQRMFWEQNLGGFPGDLSEIGRRFIPRKRREEQYNPYRNKMPTWLPGPEYFLDFRHGDPYSKITGGEYRLPGGGYEALNKLHPDMFGQYGAIDRFKILADVAPYSEQYKYYKGVMSRYNQLGWLTDQQKADVKVVKKQVQEAKSKYDFTPYKFKYADTEEKWVTISRSIDDTTFMTEEFPDHPIRLAGIDMPPKADTSPEAKEARAYLATELAAGKRVKVQLDKDDLMRVRDDTVQTMRAAVYDSQGRSISARIGRGRFGSVMGFGGKRVGEAKWSDTSATTTAALYTKSEITIGKVWEAISHLDTPLHTKLLQNRSPLEQYKRREVYGKNWQSWNHPIRDWISPTLNKMASSNPIIATAAGAFIGALFKAKGSRRTAATIGAAVAGTLSTLRVAREAAGRVINSDYTWIPKTRQQERDINEYFDILKYMKYKGLYQKARQLAIKNEGVDVEKFLGNTREVGKTVQKQRRALEEQKRWIKINMTDKSIDQVSVEEAKAELDKINAQLNGYDNQRGLVQLGPMALEAIKFKTTYESTLYGADPNGGMVQIYRALPNKDREFYREFLLAAPEEREEILRLVPKNQRRFYQAKWGLEVDKPVDLEQYFKTHYLPRASWAGWKPDVSLQAVKLKVVQNEALDMTEFGFFQGDEQFAAGAPMVKPFRPSSFINLGAIQQVLRGAGLTKVDVRQAVSPSEAHGITVDVNVEQDRRPDVLSIMNGNMRTMIKA
jgi:hypothetical protein